ncbi:MAG: hypothetical protein CVV28_11190 [Methanobacteriales archaeon HGW-Methanobacteriales-1]|nr:MAG: hypothetical protein CVV28_11190 [Methanobacteriales archaeon HGW-Methanobacteriales-1]
MKTWMKFLNSTFDFKDKINSSLGRETRVDWNNRKLKEYSEYLRNLKIKNLDIILDELMNNWRSGFYKELMLSFVADKDDTRFLTFDELYNNRLLVLAAENLSKTNLKTIAFSKTDLNVFKTMQPFIDTIYFMNIGHKFTWEDVLNTFFNGLDARLMFGLDKFDELKDAPEPTAEFFQKLGETQIASKATSDLYMKLTLLQMHIEDDIFGINSDDVIMAYKTFLKLIKTDITVYKAPQSIIDSMHEFTGALVCDKCVVSHGMGPEDSPDDFENTCECGGHLIYKKEI